LLIARRETKIPQGGRKIKREEAVGGGQSQLRQENLAPRRQGAKKTLTENRKATAKRKGQDLAGRQKSKGKSQKAKIKKSGTWSSHARREPR